MPDASELHFNNYVSLAISTALVYDYILTFTDEIEYIWDKPWTRVSTLYILVRYCGLGGGVIYSLGGSSFIFGPAKRHVFTHVLCFQGYILVIFGQWATLLFIGAADLTMILRVWAIYARSKIVISILLVLYILETVPLVFESIIASTKFTGTTSHALEFSFCVTHFLASNAVAEVLCIVQIPLAATMCLLVTARFIRQSMSMYAAQKKWHVGHYMNLFVKEGMLYFLALCRKTQTYPETRVPDFTRTASLDPGHLPIRIAQFSRGHRSDGRVRLHHWALFIPTSTRRSVGNFYEVGGSLQSGHFTQHVNNNRHPAWDKDERAPYLVGWVAPGYLWALETHFSLVPIRQGRPERNCQTWVVEALKGLNQPNMYTVQMDYAQQMAIVEKAWGVGDA